ncbi:MAG: 5-carboxymethyl-2-hydroxymuconate Delta-isomerase [Thiolinea sp.]
MAHFILEYSDNIDKETLFLPRLFADLHQAAVETGLFPLKGIRSRAYPCHDYRMADGNPEHCFMHLTVLLGHGRSLEEREAAAQRFFQVYSAHFDDCFARRGVAMSFEMKELEPVLKYNRNNIQDYL